MLFFNSIYILLHIFNHYLYEEVGLRQIMDYYFFVCPGRFRTEGMRFAQSIKLGIIRIARSVMWVMKTVFNMKDSLLLLPPDEKSGRELLKEVMSRGNMGHELIENKVIEETMLHRLCRRYKRKIRLFKYNSIDVIISPYYRLKLLFWKRTIIMYNLKETS